jgi:hypothetical protein
MGWKAANFDIDDMLPIAYGQTKLENHGQSVADKYLFLYKFNGN